MKRNDMNTKTMKQLFRNVNGIKKNLRQGYGKFDARDYPFFCLVLGYLLNKVNDFSLLYQTLSLALELVVNEKFPEPQYNQLILFIQQNPHRLADCNTLVENIKSDETLDVFDEMQTLLSSTEYRKRPLKESNRCFSIDTEPVHSLSPQYEKNFKLNDHYDNEPQQQKPPYIDEFDYQLIRKMQEEDQKMARRLQQQEENIMKQYKPKMAEQQTMCEICYVDLYEGDPSFLDSCGHGFHKQCMMESFKIQISTNTFPLTCPNQGCKMACLENNIKEVLNNQLFEKYQQNTLKAYADMHGDSVSWCPTADCGYMFFFQKGDNPRFQCLECKKQYCLNCRCQWHKDMTCAEYKVSSTVSEDDKKFLDFVEGKKFKQCPKCKFWVQKNQGCDHMTCKCKFEFCYKCGGVYMKCDCAVKARQQFERRRVQRQQSRRKKEQAKQRKRRQKQQREERIARGEQQPSRRGRSKKQSKK